MLKRRKGDKYRPQRGTTYHAVKAVFHNGEIIDSKKHKVRIRHQPKTDFVAKD